MDLRERVETSWRALGTLKELLDREVGLDDEWFVILRDACVQRFEYTFEVVWKTLKAFLWSVEKLECFSPRSCFRTAMKAGILSPEEAELALEMVDARNTTAHTYREEVAQAIFRRLRVYADLMGKLLQRLENRILEEG